MGHTPSLRLRLPPTPFLWYIHNVPDVISKRKTRPNTAYVRHTHTGYIHLERMAAQ
jgi:hypothetical protein